MRSGGRAVSTPARGHLGPYVAFRLETQYGSRRAQRGLAPDPADVVAYLEWLRTQV